MAPPPPPLPATVAIVDPTTGRPTVAFIQWLARVNAFLAQVAAAVP